MICTSGYGVLRQPASQPDSQGVTVSLVIPQTDSHEGAVKFQSRRFVFGLYRYTVSGVDWYTHSGKKRSEMFGKSQW